MRSWIWMYLYHGFTVNNGRSPTLYPTSYTRLLFICLCLFDPENIIQPPVHWDISFLKSIHHLLSIVKWRRWSLQTYDYDCSECQGLVEQHGGLDRVSFLPTLVSLAWLDRVETFNDHHCRSRPLYKTNQVAIPGTGEYRIRNMCTRWDIWRSRFSSALLYITLFDITLNLSTSRLHHNTVHYTTHS